MRHGALVLGSTWLLIAAGCGSGETYQESARRGTETRSESARQPAIAETPPFQAGDVQAILDFCDLTWEWNRAAAPLVRDYLDPNVPVDVWVRNAGPLISRMRGIHVRMQTGVLGLRTPQMRATFQAMSDNYKLKLAAVTALHNSIAARDAAGEQAALAALQKASTEGTALASAWLDNIRPYVNQEELAAELKKRGKEIADLMGP